MLGLSLDQATKAGALSALTPGVPFSLAPGLDLTLGFNRGVVFGLFASDTTAGRLLLIAVTGGIVLALLAWAIRERRPVVRIALGLVVGGAVGNLVDRIRSGAVTDFIDVHLGGLHWPAFNLADAAICVGVTILSASHLAGRQGAT